MMRIVNLSVNSADPRAMCDPLLSMAEKEGIEITIDCFTANECEDDPLRYRDLVNASRSADLIIIRCMTDPTRFKRFDTYEQVLREVDGYVFIHSGNSDVRFMYRDLFKGTDEEYITLGRYVGYRGAENDMGIGYWLHSRLGGDLPVPEPVVQRTDGIYHPHHDRDITLDDYLKTLDPSKPTVGILFVASYWIYHNTKHIDHLIERMEAGGMNTIPVFFSSSTAKEDGSKGTSAYVSKYFTDGNGKSRIDVMIVNSPFSQIVNSRDTRGVRTPDEENFYKFMTDVPVLQAMSVSGEYTDFESQRIGLNKSEIVSQVAWPEMDGQIITVPIAKPYGDNLRLKNYIPIEDRVDHIVKVAKNWANIRHKPAKDRKVAIVMWQSRPDSGRMGSAAGLDGMESVSDIMIRLSKEGYTMDFVPENGRQLADRLLEGVTNDMNWIPSESIREKAVALIPKKDYMRTFSSIPEFNRNMMIKNWGEPVGDISTDKGMIVIPGMVSGNVYVGFQPLRAASEQMDAMYHDPELSIPHQYLAFYRWLQDDFKADAVIHIGTHGTLEWLPGKNVGLSGKCFPDIVQNGMLDIYPYIIDDPGEGIQAKRRAESVLIGHMCPTMARAGSYDSLSKIETPLQEFYRGKLSMTDDRRVLLVSQILEACKECSILEDLGIPGDVSVDGLTEHLGDIHDYITDIKESVVRDGIHILGRAPDDEQLDESIYTLTRLRNGDIPSLRYAVADTMGIDMEYGLEHSTEMVDGMTYGELMDGVDVKVQSLLVGFRRLCYDKKRCLNLTKDELGTVSEALEKVVSYICDTLVHNLRLMTDEMDNIMVALDGRYVLPGPSGAPTRGNAHLLPMGRNYFSIDPDIIPSRSAWDTGRRMADKLIERYVNERGSYPHEIAFIIWATDTMKTNGDDVAYILWLMGVRPKWSDSNGQVTDLEIVPLEELGRPRIDVSVRITGLFRDTFPNLIDMIDDAVRLVASLDETDEENYLASNLRKDMVENLAKGMGIDEAKDNASTRIFGCPPGCYGPGVNHAIESKEWESVKDLADLYIAWGSYAYGRGKEGVQMKDTFIKRFSKSDITIKNMPDRELDSLDIDDVYGYLGGMNAFTRAYGVKDEVMSVIGDGSDPDNVRVRKTDEEIKFLFRTKVLNPKFLDGLKRHGFRGVGEISKLTEYIFGWDATSDVIDDWMYDGLTEQYLLDEKTREWMRDENPYALMEMVNRLQEAIDRGMWDASDDMKQKLRDILLETEERIEDITDM